MFQNSMRFKKVDLKLNQNFVTLIHLYDTSAYARSKIEQITRKNFSKQGAYWSLFKEKQFHMANLALRAAV